MYSLVYSCWHVIIAQYFVEIFFYLDLLYIYTSCMTLILTMLTFISVFFFFLEQWMVNGEICVGLFAIRDIKKVCLHLPSINSLSTHGWSHQSLLLCWLAGVVLFLPVNCMSVDWNSWWSGSVKWKLLCFLYLFIAFRIGWKFISTSYFQSMSEREGLKWTCYLHVWNIGRSDWYCFPWFK